MPRRALTPNDEPPKRPASLEDQLASVMEQEGMTVLAADGVRFMRTPTQVEVKRVKKRRRGSKTGTAYAGRPTVSLGERSAERDGVADLDRVVVGFAEASAPKLKRTSIHVRMAEHARSPYVVSLRGLALSAAPVEQTARVSQSRLKTHDEMPVASRPNLQAIAALASDLCIEGEDGNCQEQFTPSTFQDAYAMSYGAVSQLAYTVTSAVDDATRWLGSLGSHSRNTKSSESLAPSTVVTQVNRVSFFRVAAGIGALLLVATLPANAVRLTRSFEKGKAAAVSAGSRAIAAAQAAAVAPLPESVDALRRTSARFREADDVLNSTNALAVGLAGLVPETRAAYRSAKALTEIGAKSSDAAGLLATGLAAAMNGEGSPLERLQVMSAYAEGALPLLDDAADAMNNVDPESLPAERRDQVAELAHGIEGGRVAIREFIGLAELMGTLLGKNEPRRYLVIFQNPSELRPTGGFMGSFAEATFDRGELVKLHVPPGGTYDVQGQLVARVAPPAPLSLIAERWEFQDSNWAPDFTAASDKIRWFWSKAGGPTVDGVIAVNASLVVKFLELTGPIEVPEVGKTITAENFMLETQKAVELEYDREENQPKKILGLLAPRIIEKLRALPQERSLAVLGIMNEALETKDVQVSLSDASEDTLARRFGWSGQMKPVPGDTLAVIAANIAGQKTDSAVDDTVVHDVVISTSGSIEDTVTVTREHTASKGELFRGVRNVSYFRIYVPRGSTLLEASGFTTPDASFFQVLQDGLETDPDEAEKARTLQHLPNGVDVWDEGERTVFGGWSMVDPGQTLSFTVHYKLPFTVFDIRSRLDTGPEDGGADPTRRAAYSLLLTSQSGTPRREIRSHVTVPEGWNVKWGREAEGIETVWDRDRVIAALYELAR